jgi:hypothetical protein
MPRRNMLPPSSEMKNKPSKKQAIINLGHCIQVQNTRIPSARSTYMDHIIREVIEVELRHVVKTE